MAFNASCVRQQISIFSMLIVLSFSHLQPVLLVVLLKNSLHLQIQHFRYKSQFITHTTLSLQVTIYNPVVNANR